MHIGHREGRRLHPTLGRQILLEKLSLHIGHGERLSRHCHSSVGLENAADAENSGLWIVVSEVKTIPNGFLSIAYFFRSFVFLFSWIRTLCDCFRFHFVFSDCNPYGVSVLDTYMHHQGVKLSADENNQRHKKKKSKPRNGDEEEDSFDIRWIGLRPSQVESMGLPAEVFQELTSNDVKRLDSLLVPKSSRFKPFVEGGRDKAQRVSELEAMRKYKVELEALLWKGPGYLSRFVHEAVMKEESQQARRGEKVTQRRRREHPGFRLSDDSASPSDRHDDEIPDTIEW